MFDLGRIALSGNGDTPSNRIWMFKCERALPRHVSDLFLFWQSRLHYALYIGNSKISQNNGAFMF